jgi:class 3 adenylate cyclase
MALFGAPIAHEDHARRAVLAALGLRKGLEEYCTELGDLQAVELEVRMGLNTGWVVVGGIGDQLRRDYTPSGTRRIWRPASSRPRGRETSC